MKFGKKLRATVDSSYEEWRPMFMSYKDLKQCIAKRKITDVESRDAELKDSQSRDRDSENTPDSDPDRDAPPVSAADRERNLNAVREAERSHQQFFTCFKQQVDKVNEFFLDKQEDYIIEHRQLSERVQESLVPGAATRSEVNRLRQRLINFHGELVLLENFSTVNYTGFRKILKKHDKKTGLNMRIVYLKTVLITPFFLSDTVRKLVLKTESQLAQLHAIKKFRRPNSRSPLSLDAPSTDVNPPVVIRTVPKQTTLPPDNPPTMLSAPPIDAPGTEVTMEPPRPHAFISPRSALWRLYTEGRAFGSTMCQAISTAPSTKRLPTPPQSLLDLVDAISPRELGLQSTFLDSVTQPSNYCIAGDDNFSMGFFVFRPKVKLQIFKAHQGGAFITKNLCGRVRMHVYQATANGSASTAPSEHGVESEIVAEKRDFCVEQIRSGVTVGPWPAISCNSPEQHMEWIPETVCAIFYVCTPALSGDVMPIYDIHPLTPPRFRVLNDPEDNQGFVRVVC